MIETPTSKKAQTKPPANRLVALLFWFLEGYNRFALIFSMTAMFVTSAILTYSVVVRYFFMFPTDWQDEVSVFMLIGMIFLSAAYVQSARGHIGIEILDLTLPPRINAIRKLIVDIVSFLFCAFFSWKCWGMLSEAYFGGYTTSTTLGPPLWIPYAMMTIGMTCLSMQIFFQILTSILVNEEKE